ncbi:MAG: hypothetical protein ACK45B_01880 [Limisphaerales bacterium]
MRINTVQTILFRQLRERHEQRQSKRTTPLKPGRSEVGTMPKSVKPVRGAIAKLRRWFHVVNCWLASYYALCGKIAPPSPPGAIRMLRLHADEPMRLNQGRGAIHQGASRTMCSVPTPARAEMLPRRGIAWGRARPGRSWCRLLAGPP